MPINLDEVLLSTQLAERTIARYAHKPAAQLSRTELLELNAALKQLIVGMDRGYKPMQAVNYRYYDLLVSS